MSTGLLFILYCCLLCQLNAVGSHCIPDIASGFSLYSGHHKVSFRLFVKIVIKIQSLECVWVTVGVGGGGGLGHQLLHVCCCNNEYSYLNTLPPITDPLCVCGRYIEAHSSYVCMYIRTF